MDNLVPLFITLVIFIFIGWIAIKIIKFLFKKSKSLVQSVKELVVPENVKQERINARNYILDCIKSDVISDEQMENSEVTKYLTLKEREQILKDFVGDLIIAENLRFSDFDKVEDLAECLNISTENVMVDLENLSIRMIEKELRSGRFDENAFPVQIPLKRDEIVFFSTFALLVGAKTTRRYTGGNRGISFRVAKGVYYKIGASGGQSESVKEDVYESNGELIITNKRVVFAGESESFEIYSDKIINYLFREAMLIINVSNRKGAYRVEISETFKGCVDAAIQLSIEHTTK